MEFIRGDTEPFRFKINYRNNELVPLSDIDTLILTCRKYNTEECGVLFTKDKEDFTVSDGYYHCKFDPADTQTLDYGTYNFDIEATLVNGYRKTLKSNFKITEEDTIHGSGNIDE